MSEATERFQELLDIISSFEPGETLRATGVINEFVFPGGQPAGLAGVEAALAALQTGGFFDAPPAASVNVPALIIGGAQENAQLFNFGTGTAATGDIDIALGAELRAAEFDMLLRARQDQRATIDQQVSIAMFLAEAERASPTRAASINAHLGLGSGGIDFGFADVFLSGGQLAPGRGGVTTGTVGGQQVGLPNTLSLNQLAFADANPMIARFIADLGDFLGIPDIFGSSVASAVPTSSALAGLAL